MISIAALQLTVLPHFALPRQWVGGPQTKVARYRRERTLKEREKQAQEKTVRSFPASSFLHTLSCGLRRGRATFAGQNGTTTASPLPPLNPKTEVETTKFTKLHERSGDSRLT